MPAKVKEALAKNLRLIYSVRDPEPADKKRKYWCFPAFGPQSNSDTPSAYTMAEELVRDYPDPAEHWVGFVCAAWSRHKQNYSVFVGGGAKEKPRNSVAVPASNSSAIVKKQSTTSTNNYSKRPKPVVQSFINKMPKSTTRPKEAKRQSSVVPVTVHREEEKLAQTRRDDPNGLIIEEEENVEEGPQFASAGSGSESAARFRFSVTSRQSPPLGERDRGKTASIVENVASPRPGTARANNSTNKAEGTLRIGKLRGSDATSKAQKPAGGPKSAREHQPKDFSRLKATIEKHL